MRILSSSISSKKHYTHMKGFHMKDTQFDICTIDFGMKIKTLFQYASFIGITLAVLSCGGGPKPPIPAGVGKPSGNVATNSTVATKSYLPDCNVNVYIENSASMDGYVKGVTEFEQSVYSYISDIKLLDFCKTLNLNYINTQILKQPNDVKDFIEKLEPFTFRQRGGDRRTTDVSELFKSIMAEQGPDDISILISDFVFSPGRDNASEYLTNQQIGIKGQFAIRLKEDPNYAALLYRLVSKFDGTYYNKYDHPTQINEDRPFFIWILGNKDQLHRLEKAVDKKNMKGKGVDHSYSISKMEGVAPYGILPMPRIGSFNLDPHHPKTNILKAKIDKKSPKNKFVVSFGVDYSGFLLDDSYLEDPSNYEINNKAYMLEISKNTNSESSYTHTIKLILDPSQPVISRGNIKISLLKKSAPWAAELTDDEGVDIFAEGAMGKTFGLKYLVDGVFDAYKAEETYSVFTINIQ